MKNGKPKRGFCDQGWVLRMKLAKRQEHLDRGEPIPRWLKPQPGKQLELFDTDNGDPADSTTKQHERGK